MHFGGEDELFSMAVHLKVPDKNRMISLYGLCVCFNFALNI